MSWALSEKSLYKLYRNLVMQLPKKVPPREAGHRHCHTKENLRFFKIYIKDNIAGDAQHCLDSLP